jgi:hypothetical protein
VQVVIEGQEKRNRKKGEGRKQERLISIIILHVNDINIPIKR